MCERLASFVGSAEPARHMLFSRADVCMHVVSFAGGDRPDNESALHEGAGVGAFGLLRGGGIP